MARSAAAGSGCRPESVFVAGPGAHVVTTAAALDLHPKPFDPIPPALQAAIALDVLEEALLVREAEVDTRPVGGAATRRTRPGRQGRELLALPTGRTQEDGQPVKATVKHEGLAATGGAHGLDGKPPAHHTRNRLGQIRRVVRLAGVMELQL